MLPDTSFSQRANAVKREPEIQAFWKEAQIYESLQDQNSAEKVWVPIVHHAPWSNALFNELVFSEHATVRLARWPSVCKW